MAKENDRDVIFDIVQHIDTITKRTSGWNLELNLISWNEQLPKFDIRAWSADHKHMARGVTLHADEMDQLINSYRAYRNQKVVDDAKAEQEEMKEKYSNWKPYKSPPDMPHETAAMSDEVTEAAIDAESENVESDNMVQEDMDLTASQVADAEPPCYTETAEAAPF